MNSYRHRQPDLQDKSLFFKQSYLIQVRHIYMKTALLFGITRLNVKIAFLLTVLPVLFSCASDLKYQRKDPLSELNFYFGNGFHFNSSYVKQEMLYSIKQHLKTAAADRNPENPEEIWREISDYSLSDGVYILFELSPETRLPTSFVDLKFELDGVKPLRVDNYYIYNISGVTEGPRIYASGFYMHGSGPVTHSVGMYYPIYDGTSDIYLSGEHLYRFLILFPGGVNPAKKHELKVRFHNGRIISFKDE